MIEITESNMLFGPYSEEDVFEIEKAELNIMAGEGISTVEFMLARDISKLLFVEAKSSTPKENSDKIRFQEFITEITDKFVHSFELYQAVMCQRYETAIPIGSNLKNMDWKLCKIKFVFVIHGHHKEWLPPIREALLREMESFSKIWKSDVVVLNDEMALKKNLISEVK